ncbi:MAG TPA: PilT/PilU family type 4a pilus ATPase [Verrucomicrobiae bacterium]
MQSIQTGTRLGQLLAWCESQNAADLHVQANQPYTVRVDGKLIRLDPNEFPPMTQEELYSCLSENFSAQEVDAIRRRREHDLSFYHGVNRYRANFSKQKGAQSFSFRFVPQETKTLRDLRLPESLGTIVDELRGLVLVTGPTGQGKSTTARALLQRINLSRAVRIVTIEDPIEFVFKDEQAQFEQREVGIDTESFADGIRNAMRQDPNIIFVGEIRDKESIFAGLQAAETGHMVLATLHADSTSQAIGRLRMYYPSNEQANVSQLLSRNLKAVITQRLIPSVNGDRLPCVEILRVDRGAQKAIAENELQLLDGIVEAGVGQGMHSFDQYLIELLAAGQITEEVARQYAVNRHRLDLTLRGILSNAAILRPDKPT